MKKMTKTQRQALLVELIQKQKIDSQEQLQRLLTAAGIPAAQATLSRDLRELNVSKTRDEAGTVYYIVPSSKSETASKTVPSVQQTLAEVAESVTQVQFLNVIKTLPGNGNLLAAVLDELSRPEIIGTLAGHDTIVVISSSEAAAKKLNHFLQQQLDND